MRRRAVQPGGLRAAGRGGAAFEFHEVERHVITAPQPFDVGTPETRASLPQLTKWVDEGRARAVCCAPGAPSASRDALLTPRPPLNSQPPLAQRLPQPRACANVWLRTRPSRLRERPTTETTERVAEVRLRESL